PQPTPTPHRLPVGVDHGDHPFRAAQCSRQGVELTPFGYFEAVRGDITVVGIEREKIGRSARASRMALTALPVYLNSVSHGGSSTVSAARLRRRNSIKPERAIVDLVPVADDALLVGRIPDAWRLFGLQAEVDLRQVDEILVEDAGERSKFRGAGPWLV